MVWFTAFPAILVALALFFAPGLFAALVLRASGLTAVAMAPVVSVALVTVLSIPLSALGVHWNPLLVMPLLLVLSGCVAMVFRFAGFSFAAKEKVRWSRSEKYVFWCSLAIPVVVLAVFYLLGVPDPERFSVRFDNVFHMNVIRHNIDMTNYSILNLNDSFSLTGGYYPDIWHLFTALIAQVPGVSIPLAINASVFVMVIVIWPLSAVFMLRNMFGNDPVANISGAVVTAVLPAFPLGFLLFGPLFPNLLSFILLPVGFVFMLNITGMIPTDFMPQKKSVMLVLITLTGAVSAVHPNGLAVIAFFAASLLSANIIMRWKQKTKKQQEYTIVLAAAIVVAVFFLYLLNPSDQWSPRRTLSGVLTDVLHLSPDTQGNEFIISAFVFVAVYFCIRSRNQLFLAFAIFSGIFSLFWIISDSSKVKFLRFLGTIWYDDVPRLAALATIGVIPLAAYGIKLGYDYVNYENRFRKVAVLGYFSCVCLLIINGLNFGVIAKFNDYYHLANEKSAVSDPDKQEILSHLSKYVPAGQRLMGDPANGAGLAYVAYGYPAIKMHMIADLTPEEQILWDHYSEAASNPAVCQAIRDLHIYYALDFPGLRLNGPGYRAKGLDNIRNASGFELVEESGNARLYRVTACS